MSDDYRSVHITYGAGIAGTPLEWWLREHTTAKLHGPGDHGPVDDPFLRAVADPMIRALFAAHRPHRCDECGGVSPIVISDDWVEFARYIDHEEGCPTSSE